MKNFPRKYRGAGGGLWRGSAQESCQPTENFPLRAPTRGLDELPSVAEHNASKWVRVSRSEENLKLGNRFYCSNFFTEAESAAEIKKSGCIGKEYFPTISQNFKPNKFGFQNVRLNF